MQEEEIRNRGIRCALRHMHSLRVQSLDERTAILQKHAAIVKKCQIVKETGWKVPI